MNVKVRLQGPTAILDVEGQITFESTPALREKILQALKSNGVVLVNLTQVAYMDSSGIATLVEGLKEAQNRKASFGLFGLTKNTRNVLRLVRLDKVFRIFDSEDDALRQLSPPA
ncbi:MAG TPA: STAS domain-containing protein [Dehalococcoidia bacterium]|nr:STAS domain-containing protein [Candidatus Acidoferrales bacterium]HLE79858.1 STAS domain-containing protein [Dehalococcoidia bacterium]